MKIDLKKIRRTPAKMDFSFCVFGKGDEEVNEWADYWGFQREASGHYTNFVVPQDFIDLSLIFKQKAPYEYLDGFSPNLNKHLHIGHLCNMILAKSIFSMGLSNRVVALLGDTMNKVGDIPASDAIGAFRDYCHKYDYNVNDTFLASNMILGQQEKEELLSDGEGDFKGTKIFSGSDWDMVGIKSNGSTTYFYQDIAFANTLKKPTLIITGTEQNGHFNKVKELCPWVDHLGMGLVLNNGVKMSSREGNVIMAKEILDELNETFKGDQDLAYNVLAGKLLSYSPSSTKNLIKKDLNDVRTSIGLYLSYTQARLLSAGCDIYDIGQFHSFKLQYYSIKAKERMNPSILLEGLEEHCKNINLLYTEGERIKGNKKNEKKFSRYLSDLSFGMKQLGLYDIFEI